MKKLNNIENDYKYLNLVDDILNHEKFVKLKECVHHGTNRFQHSVRVSYYSYKITKKLKFNFYFSFADGTLLAIFKPSNYTI